MDERPLASGWGDLCFDMLDQKDELGKNILSYLGSINALSSCSWYHEGDEKDPRPITWIHMDAPLCVLQNTSIFFEHTTEAFGHHGLPVALGGRVGPLQLLEFLCRTQPEFGIALITIYGNVRHK